MTVSCPECRSVFRVDPAKVPATGVRARCSVCGGVIAVGGGSLAVSVTPVASSGAVPNFPGGTSRATPATAAVPRAPTPMSAPSVSAGGTTPPVAGVGLRPTPAFTASVEGPTADAGANSIGTPAAGKRAINPFLRADPSQRARRLARALVSDLVAYHPQKRDEGLRDGTLRQLFREEIKKSYEEYMEQVGREVAEGSPHFREALNEILAGGRRLF